MFGYEPHPKHTLIAALYIAVGYIAIIREGWIAFGLIMIGMGIITWLVVNATIVIKSYQDYWSEINSFLQLAMKTNNPHIWTIFGMQPPPTEVKVMVKDTSKGEAYPSYQFQGLPVSPHIMRVIADGVLTGKPFSENEWTKNKIVPGTKFRKLQKLFKDKDFIRPNNTRSNNLGYSLTRKGQQVLYEFASESVKQELKKNR